MTNSNCVLAVVSFSNRASGLKVGVPQVIVGPDTMPVPPRLMIAGNPTALSPAFELALKPLVPPRT